MNQTAKTTHSSVHNPSVTFQLELLQGAPRKRTASEPVFYVVSFN